jgi:lipopolysaccharide biosynthesis regulator YciM
MGAAASAAKKESRKKLESKRFLLIHQVEKFVINVYACCPRKESMSLILSSDMASKAFLNFVKSERAEEIYAMYAEATRLSECRKKNIKIYEVSKDFKKLVEVRMLSISTL